MSLSTDSTIPTGLDVTGVSVCVVWSASGVSGASTGLGTGLPQMGVTRIHERIWHAQIHSRGQRLLESAPLTLSPLRGIKATFNSSIAAPDRRSKHFLHLTRVFEVSGCNSAAPSPHAWPVQAPRRSKSEPRSLPIGHHGHYASHRSDRSRAQY